MSSDGFPYSMNEPGNFAAVQPTDEQLLEFGYAPGSYDMKCRTCRGIVHDVDKRAMRCRGCAVNAFRAAAARPVAAVVSGPEHRLGSALTRSHLRIYRRIAEGTLGSFMAPSDVRMLLDEINRQETEIGRLREEWAQEGIGWLRDKDIDRLMGVEDENKRLTAENSRIREALDAIKSVCAQAGKDATHNHGTVAGSRRPADQRSAAYCEGILSVTDAVARLARKFAPQGIEAEGRDAKRLGATHESPVGEADAPTPLPDSRSENTGGRDGR